MAKVASAPAQPTNGGANNGNVHGQAPASQFCIFHSVLQLWRFCFKFACFNSRNLIGLYFSGPEILHNICGVKHGEKSAYSIDGTVEKLAAAGIIGPWL
jgi:hypothetical protein